MKSEDRHIARRARREEKRANNKASFMLSVDSFNRVFTFENLFCAGIRCCRGVRWKASVQRFELHLLTGTIRQLERLRSRKWKPKKASHFLLFDAGKLRQIDSVNIYTRVVQNVLCNKCIMPIAERRAIADSYASRKGKGTDYAIDRFKQYLVATECSHVVFFDYSKFFASIKHKALLDKLFLEIKDAGIRHIIMLILQMFGHDGLELGSHFSQSSSVVIGNYIDSTIKQQGVKGYGRYSDDGFMFVDSIEDGERLIGILATISSTFGLALNAKKTKICACTEVLRFLQKRFVRTEASCYIRVSQKSITKARRRCKRLFKLYEEDKILLEEFIASYNTWISFAGRYANKAAVYNLFMLVKNKLDERGIKYDTERNKMLRLR